MHGASVGLPLGNGSGPTIEIIRHKLTCRQEVHRDDDDDEDDEDDDDADEFPETVKRVVRGG